MCRFLTQKTPDCCLRDVRPCYTLREFYAGRTLIAAPSSHTINLRRTTLLLALSPGHVTGSFAFSLGKRLPDVGRSACSRRELPAGDE